MRSPDHIPEPATDSRPTGLADEAPGDQFDLAMLLRPIWRRRWFVILTTAVVAVLAAGYSMLVTPIYRAEALVMPRELRGAAVGLSAQLAQLGGLADLAGLSVSASGKQEPLGVLRSRGFAQRFIVQQGIAGKLAEAGRSSLFTEPAGETDMRRLVTLFLSDVADVSEDRKSGLITVAVNWRDPVEAAQWANALVAQLNAEMRARALREAQRNIDYLRSQWRDTDAVSVQLSVSRMLEAEMNKMLVARGSEEYSMRVIDSAEPPLLRAWPKRTFIVMLATVLAMLGSIAAALAWDPVRRLVTAVRSG